MKNKIIPVVLLFGLLLLTGCASAKADKGTKQVKTDMEVFSERVAK